jgi:hypothetical protein
MFLRLGERRGKSLPERSPPRLLFFFALARRRAGRRKERVMSRR